MSVDYWKRRITDEAGERNGPPGWLWHKVKQPLQRVLDEQERAELREALVAPTRTNLAARLKAVREKP